MVTAKADGAGVVFEVWAEPPLIYLDHWALRRLSSEASLNARFSAAFRNRGTVMFSLMNVVEIASDASPERAAQIRAFLDSLGPHWVPMTIDAARVLAVEAGEVVLNHNVCVSAGFLSDRDFAEKIAQGSVSLSHVVDLTRGQNGHKLRQETQADTQRLVGHLEDWRSAYKKDASVIDKRWPTTTFDGKAPMRSIYNGLIRLTITDGFKLNDNHARDLYHSLAAVRCAELVTLDAHWAGQVRKLRLPRDFGQVFTESQIGDFLVALETATATR